MSSQAAQTAETHQIVEHDLLPAAKPATPLREKLTILAVGAAALGLTAGWIALLGWLALSLL